MSLIRKEPVLDPVEVFWSKVQRIFGEIPKIIRMLLELNGFESFLALKGIRWEDKKYFFDCLEDSIRSLELENNDDEIKEKFAEELAANHQKFSNFKIKLGHKNLIINLFYELQKINLDEFNATVVQPESKRIYSELIVRKPPEEHRYSKENEKKNEALVKIQDEQLSEQTETIQFVYETEEDDEGGSQFVEHTEYLEELELEGDNEMVEYHEVQPEEMETDENCIYTSEQIIKQEADEIENSVFEVSGYDSSSSQNRSGPKSKRPKHMYTSEFLQTQMTQGRIGTPGRRRPKIQKNYPETEEGMLERWADLVRQSCEVIIPLDLIALHDLSQIDITKLHENIWEVKCPMCAKKLRLQLTQEGKYVNYKRSNFERHLRIVHYKQIRQFKPNDSDEELFERGMH